METPLLGGQEVRLDRLRHQPVPEHVAITGAQQESRVERCVDGVLSLGLGEPADPVDCRVVDEAARDRHDGEDLALGGTDVAHASSQKTEQAS